MQIDGTMRASNELGRVERQETLVLFLSGRDASNKVPHTVTQVCTDSLPCAV